MAGPLNPRHAMFILSEHGVTGQGFTSLDIQQRRELVSKLLNRPIRGLHWHENFMRAAEILIQIAERRKS